MAISAQRFKFLDKETNLPTTDFTAITSNLVYNAIDQLPDTSILNIRDNTKLLDTLQRSVNDLTAMLENNETTRVLKNQLDSVIDSIPSKDLPGSVQGVFSSLKELDSGGVKDFFQEALSIGATVLCNNSNFLKTFAIGQAVSNNILSGLILTLLLSWIDKFCSSFSDTELSSLGNLDVLNTLYPPKGVNVNSENALQLFTRYYRDYLNSNSYSFPSAPIDNVTFLNNIVTGNIDSTLSQVRDSEISHADRDALISLLETELPNYAPNSPEYNNILRARGELLNLPLISSKRREKDIRYSNLPEKLGSYIKNLSHLGSLEPKTYSLSSVEKSLYDKMVGLKDTAIDNLDIQVNPIDSFKDFDFSTILPSLTVNEKNYVLSSKEESDSHRQQDLHPTTEIFIEGV